MDAFIAACAAELRLPAQAARAFAGAMLLRIRRTSSFEEYVRVLSRVPGAIPLVAGARRRGGRLDPLDPARRARLEALFFEEVARHAGPGPASRSA